MLFVDFDTDSVEKWHLETVFSCLCLSNTDTPFETQKDSKNISMHFEGIQKLLYICTVSEARAFNQLFCKVYLFVLCVMLWVTQMDLQYFSHLHVCMIQCLRVVFLGECQSSYLQSLALYTVIPHAQGFFYFHFGYHIHKWVAKPNFSGIKSLVTLHFSYTLQFMLRSIICLSYPKLRIQEWHLLTRKILCHLFLIQTRTMVITAKEVKTPETFSANEWMNEWICQQQRHSSSFTTSCG